MSDALTANHGVMEGKGAYNRHATGEAAGGASAVPLLVQAAREKRDEDAAIIRRCQDEVYALRRRCEENGIAWR
jgi:hypothetical protein